MPTYQYACTECEHNFEQFQSFSEDSLTECPECSGKLRKLFNAVGVVFKGSGFYRTDSRSADKSASEPKSEPKADTKPEKKAETKTESKPAAATSA
jgi:putative FmdB family regulatory protein